MTSNGDHARTSVAAVKAAYERMMGEVCGGESPYERRLGRAPTARELLDELELIVDDARRFHADEGLNETAALMTAQLASGVRDFNRRSIGLGDVASLFAGWLINSAQDDMGSAPLETAYLAVTGSGKSALAQELREFVEAYASGRVDDEEFSRRFKATYRD